MKSSPIFANGNLPAFLRDLIGCPPMHGAGVHQWLFKVARHLHAHRSAEDIVALLGAACEGCGRHVPEKEIRDAVVSAGKVPWMPGGKAWSVHLAREPRWPAVDTMARKLAMESAGISGLADLREASPVICTADSTDAEFFADLLFPDNPLLCVGSHSADFRTARREEFHGKLTGLSLIVPSPMSALNGRRKKDNKLSLHTLENTGPRHYLVTEFDKGTQDEQAATIWHLRQFAPLVAVVWSGGKSLHAWWNCRTVDETKVRRFMWHAVRIGADPATWTRSQFVRLPQGWRKDKMMRQEVAYFDPAKSEGGRRE